MKKVIRRIFLLAILLILYIYVANVTLMPESVVLIQGDNLNLFTLWGVNVSKVENGQTIQASTNLTKTKVEDIGKINLNVSAFGFTKDVSVNVVPKTKVIPLGGSIGLKLYTSGVLVVGMSEIEGKKPYEHTGIETGDRIIKIDQKEITCTADLVQTVNNSRGKEVSVEFIKENEQEETVTMVPAKTSNDEYKLGLWVRDAAAGVGTATFYEPSSQMFASLGHGITDIDTGNLITIRNGELVSANILSIVKGKRGTPGELRGSIENGKKIGEVYTNTPFGIFGKVSSTSNLNITNSAVEVLSRNEVKTGKAQIICEIETGKKKYYNIEIQRIYTNNYRDNKSMLIKVTDEELLEKTGGIIQGMSGSPILQEGKFVGAVTHVLVNDPSTGYGVFADMMLKTMKSTGN